MRTRTIATPVPAPRTIDDLELMALSRTEWRVRDGRIAEDDAFSLLGFIEEVGGWYEVMEFGDPVEFALFGTVEAAVLHFADLPVTDLPAAVPSRPAERIRLTDAAWSPRPFTATTLSQPVS